MPEPADLAPTNASGKREFSISDFYFSFDGRISVADYWVKGVLVILPLAVLALVADVAIGANGFIYMGYMLVAIWVGAALLVKRWHDRNKSGWHYWIMLIPLVGPVWTFIEAGCMEGTKGDNRYGPDPIHRRR